MSSMYYNQYSLLIACFLLWSVILLVTTIKMKGKKISSKKVGWFVCLLILVAGLRLGLYFYLKVILNKYGLFDDLLSILLYPELPFSREFIDLAMRREFDITIPLYHYPKFWLINVPLFTFGTFVWLYPFLTFILERKTVSSNSE